MFDQAQDTSGVIPQEFVGAIVFRDGTGSETKLNARPPRRVLRHFPNSAILTSGAHPPTTWACLVVQPCWCQVYLRYRIPYIES